jgi:outer membrane protein assembly factor BamB
LAPKGQVEVDPALAGVPVTIPGPLVNTEWAQPGGSASKSMGHVALGDTLSQAWSVSIGSGSGAQARLAAEPVVADGRVYTIDTRAVVRAFSAREWRPDLVDPGPRREFAERDPVRRWRQLRQWPVYATNGAGDAAALDATTGAIVWMVKPGGPLRGAPTIASDNVYVDQPGQLALCARRGQW